MSVSWDKAEVEVLCGAGFGEAKLQHDTSLQDHVIAVLHCDPHCEAVHHHSKPILVANTALGRGG